jgi:hypothetical protein
VILVVDDERLLRTTIERAVTSLGEKCELPTAGPTRGA